MASFTNKSGNMFPSMMFSSFSLQISSYSSSWNVTSLLYCCLNCQLLILSTLSMFLTQQVFKRTLRTLCATFLFSFNNWTLIVMFISTSY
jgi:hypothetical protein